MLYEIKRDNEVIYRTKSKKECYERYKRLSIIHNVDCAKQSIVKDALRLVLFYKQKNKILNKYEKNLTNTCIEYIKNNDIFEKLLIQTKKEQEIENKKANQQKNLRDKNLKRRCRDV